MTLSPEGQQLVDELAQRHGFSADAVAHMLQAVANGYGTQAQFNHPEFGGMGQWSQGGMIMIGDMFNNGLKARVDALCNDLARALAGRNVFAAAPAASQQQWQGGQAQRSGSPGWQTQNQGGGGNVSLFVGGSGGNWWPGDLGSPSSTGAQNDLRYAYFPSSRRLAIDLRGKITVYDTGDHQITGVSQQQSGDASFTFTSPYGLVRVADLQVVAPADSTPIENKPVENKPAENKPVDDKPTSAAPAAAAPAPRSVSSGATGAADRDEIFNKLERLADLQAKGILSADEFSSKKAELLARI